MSRSQEKAELAKLLSHPTRVEILKEANRHEISPAEFARERGLKTSTVSEHFQKLADYGAIKLVRLEPVRGGVKKVYAATINGLITVSQWQELPPSVQSDLAAAGLGDFMGIIGHAIETGSLSARRDSIIDSDEASLDDIGWRTLVEMIRLVRRKLPKLEEESAIRLQESGETAVSVVVGLAIFEAPKPTALAD